MAGAAPRLRWPNDLLVSAAGEFRKAAGILTEMATTGEAVRHIVVGIGLNVNGQDFPPDLAERATSLRMAFGRAFDRVKLLVDFLAAFETTYDDFLARGPASGLRQWRRYADLGRVCRIDQDGTKVEGIATDIDDSGALLVRDDAGRVHRVISGETSEHRQRAQLVLTEARADEKKDLGTVQSQPFPFRFRLCGFCASVVK